MKQKRLSTSLEDYLEAIYNLCLEKNLAHANKIADRLGVGRSSVSWALNQLSKKELINYAPYEAITLTKKGQNLAQQLAGRHQAIKDFLIEVLAVDEKTAEQNACRMEHSMGKMAVNRLVQFIDYIHQCPRTGEDWVSNFNTFYSQKKIAEADCPQCLSACLERYRKKNGQT